MVYIISLVTDSPTASSRSTIRGLNVDNDTIYQLHTLQVLQWDTVGRLEPDCVHQYSRKTTIKARNAVHTLDYG